MKKINTIKHVSLTSIFLIGFCCSAETIEIGNITYSVSVLGVGDGQPTFAVCDLDSDGNQDVVIANDSDNTIISFLSDGNGALSRVGNFSAGGNPSGLAASDINGDGNVDLVIANHDTSHVTMFFGVGDGSFKASPDSPLHLNVRPHLHIVRLNDLDDDNQVDLIVDSRDDEGLLVLKGLANGKFETPGKLISVGGDPYLGFAIGDLNVDNSLDLVSPNQRDVGVLINANSKEISFVLSNLAQSGSPFAVELAEMNGDGKTDLIVATFGRMVRIIPGDGRGNFLESQKTEIETSTGAKRIATGDINGDGIEDAVVSSWSGEILTIIGGEKKIESISFEHESFANPWGVALLDLNKDGKSDFLVGDGNGKRVAVHVSQSE